MRDSTEEVWNKIDRLDPATAAHKRDDLLRLVFIACHPVLSTDAQVALTLRLLGGLQEIEQTFINGNLEQRVPHNLNMSFNYVEGESLIMGVKGIAVSSGSACTSASLEPSYVLRALGRSDELAHSSLRMTIGRFTTVEEIDTVVKTLKDRVAKLRELSPLWDMYQEGIDLSTIQWAAH